MPALSADALPPDAPEPRLSFAERAAQRRRWPMAIMALVVESLLVLLVLTLQSVHQFKGKPQGSLVSFAVAGAKKPSPKPSEHAAKPSFRNPTPITAQTQANPRPVPTPPPPVPHANPTPAFIPLSHDEMASADISKLPSTRAGHGRMGPADDQPAEGDTPQVSGTGPNGEPLYAASWYREPYDSELRGYLSTASGPGWGLIACKTIPDWKVDDCVIIDEWPSGSGIARAAKEAAWQFKVRPPRVGGRLKIGEWVRIRIDYEERRRTR